MRRFLTLVCLLSLAIPAGISISGCTRNPSANYCNGDGYGMKITDIASITLQPATTGISLAYGQMHRVSAPSAVTCKSSSVSGITYAYGTSNNQLVDISPGGMICAGTWNRNTGGGIADYTVCSPPNPLPSTGGLPYASAYITVSAQAVTSNPVMVYVHPQVTSVSLVSSPLSGMEQQCYSQNSQAILDAQACYAGANNQQVQLCAPAGVTQCPYAAGDPRCNNPSLYFACPAGLPSGVTSVPNCTSSIGTLSYSVGTGAVASILTNTTTNQVTITAEQPGTTAITASVAGSGSSAGYFSTCPPKSISLALANNATSGTITQGVTENLTTTVTDTNGNPITGLTLDYQSTDPMDISVTTAGEITTSFPGVASVYAICQAPSCNPTPINEVGLYGTGLPVSSNPVTITTPGTTSEYVWFGAPGQSQYFTSIDLLTGSVGSPVRLPYVPNSMVMDRLGNNLFFGSPHELMLYNTATNVLASEITSVPGVVLAVSPNTAQLLINDQARQVFYIYGVSGGSTTTFGGMGNAAAWSPDSKTLYITDNAALNNAAEGITGHTDTLYVYNQSNWTTYPLPPSPLSSSLPPGVSAAHGGLFADERIAVERGRFGHRANPGSHHPLGGRLSERQPTVAHTWCPSGIGRTTPAWFSIPWRIRSMTLPASRCRAMRWLPPPMASTFWARPSPATAQHSLTSALQFPSSIACLRTTDSGNQTIAAGTGDALSPLTLTHTVTTLPLSGVSPTAINQVVASPKSELGVYYLHGGSRPTPAPRCPTTLPATSSAPYTWAMSR
jgi:hypothetical protein